MNYAHEFQLSWAIAALGWLVAFIAVQKGWALWRINGDLAHRYHELKKRYEEAIEDHKRWYEEEPTDPGVRL